MSDSGDKPSGPTEEMVRKLLALNPQLRGDGQSTKDVLAVVQGNLQGNAPPTGAPNPAPLAPAKMAPPNLSDGLQKLRVAFEQGLAELQKKQASLKQEETALPAKRRVVHEQACERIIASILASDPNLTRPESLALLQRYKPLLDLVGFSQQKLLAAEQKKARK